MTITEARQHYRLIRGVLVAERAMRERVLSEPRRSEAIREIDDALAALKQLGQIVQAANQAGLLESVAEQAPLLDLPKPRKYT